MIPPGFDVARARAETPGIDSVVHLMACGAGLMPRAVLETLKAHLDREAEIGGYEAEDEAAPRIEAAYGAIARMLNCSPDEIAIVENATVAWDMAFYGFPLKAGDRILTAVSEYASNYIAYLQVARRTGAEIVVVPNDASGQLDVGALDSLIDESTALISITHVPTNGGLVNPAAAVGAVAKRHGIPFFLDACQSAGQMPLDVAAIGCDVLTATGRKYLRGPRGTGFLYVRKSFLERLEPPFLDLRSATWSARDGFVMRPDSRRFENWENYVAGKIGLGVAVDYALAWGLDDIQRYVWALAEGLRRQLAARPGIALHDLGRERCGIVSFSVDGLDPSALAAAMRRRAINISTSSAASTRIDMDQRDLPLINRLGLHYYNNENDLSRFLHALDEEIRAA